MADVMTSHVVNGTLEDAKQAAAKQIFALLSAGMIAVRTKIETVPWHEEAPSSTNGLTMAPNRYFESHVQAALRDNAPDGQPSDFSRLAEIAKTFGAHLSQNMKKRAHGISIHMLTLRTHEGTWEDFKLEVEALVGAIHAAGISLRKSEIEYAILDTNVDHDAAWLKADAVEVAA